jgi:hypothetical protein
MELIDKKQHLIAGMVVWACDYRYTSLDDKPIRHVKPTKCLVRHTDETDKNIYYSDFFLSPYGKKGQILKRVIPIYDNTGYRTMSGTALLMFDNEIECREAYKEFKTKNLLLLASWWKRKQATFDEMFEQFSTKETK